MQKNRAPQATPGNAKGAPAYGAPAVSARQREIITVATDAFYRLGFGSASIRDIAGEIRFTQAAIYYHFPNKEEILFAIIDGFTDYLHETLEKAFSTSSDPAQGLRHAMQTHILLSESRFRETKLVIEEKRSLSPEHRALITRKENAIYQLYKSRIAALIGGGRARRVDASAATFALLGVINYFYHWFRPGGRLKLARLAADSIEVLLEGLLLPCTKAPVRGKKARAVKRD